MILNPAYYNDVTKCCRCGGITPARRKVAYAGRQILSKCSHCNWNVPVIAGPLPPPEEVAAQHEAWISAAFWSRVDKSGGEDACWLWTGPAKPTGYGRFHVLSQKSYAHRTAWMWTNGPVPEGMYVCHRCDNPPCVNPKHLFLGTHQDNMRDARAKGRFSRHGTVSNRGARNGQAKLTADSVREIRKLLADGLTRKKIAERYGVKASAIDAIAQGHSWRSVL